MYKQIFKNLNREIKLETPPPTNSITEKYNPTKIETLMDRLNSRLKMAEESENIKKGQQKWSNLKNPEKNEEIQKEHQRPLGWYKTV